MHVEHKTAMTDREKSNPETDESLPLEGNEAESSDQSETLVRIVAIGASAGGLEPIEQFFDNMSIDTGLAFVIIQHLSPNFQSMMDQLIERHTNMKVVHAEDGMHIDPNVIYLNPPRTALSIKDGKLETTAYPDTDMLSLPIDAFFTSLAEEAGSDAIGIVMSGTGSDGTKGSQSIIEKGGTVIAQDPESAKFQSMPRKVVESDAASFVASISDIPDILQAIIDGVDVDVEIEDEQKEERIESSILAMLQRIYGTDFRYYKNTTVNRRILRRALLKRYRNLDSYYERLQTDREELDALYYDLLIGVTAFFRDQEAFEIIRQKIVPELAEHMNAERQLRIWVPGCATGEEAYSLAILISHYAKQNDLTLNLKIFATDIHFRSLDFAARGIYSKDTLHGMPGDLLDNYFTLIDDRYQVTNQLRKQIVFSQHNLIKDPPFTKLDMISCRNLLIYLNDVAQQKVLALFHFALRKKGFLFLGPSESVGDLEKEFEILDKRWRVFSKLRDIHLRESSYLLPLDQRQSDSSSLKETRPVSVANVKRESQHRQALNFAYDKLLDKFAPASLLVNKDGDLVHVFGNSDRFLQVRKGVFSKKVVDLVHEKLRLIINAGIERTFSLTAYQAFECSVDVDLEPGQDVSLNVRIDKLDPQEKHPEHVLVTIEEKSTPKSVLAFPEDASSISHDNQEFYVQRIAALENELKSTGESLQNTIEELETSNEELQATNEELMASNEELQSTNEELHSVNEELYTVSAEHQRKIAELTELTDDMENLLRSTQIGTVFLDDEFKIRRYTPAATHAFNLLPHDLGRPINHVTYRFPRGEFLAELSDVISEGKVINREVDIEGRTYLLTLLPYKTEIGTITGAVINIVDVHDLKVAQVGHAKEKEFYKTVVDTQGDLICRFKKDMTLTYANDAFCAHYGIRREDLPSINYMTMFSEPQRDRLQQIVKRVETEIDLDWEQEDKRNGRSGWYHIHMHALNDDAGNVIEIQSVSRNVTDLKERENLMADFNGIASDSERSLPDKIDAILRRFSSHLNASGAILLRIEDGVGNLERMVGLEDTGLRRGATQTFPAQFCEDKNCSKQKDLCFGNFATCRFGEHPMVGRFGYETIAGSPVFIDGKMQGALSFVTSKGDSHGYVDAIQPAIDRIADWIGFELNRHTQTQRLEELNQKLIREEQRFRNLYMNAPVLMYSIDIDGRIVEASNNYLSVLGYNRDDVIGRLSTDFMSEESALESIDRYIPDFWDKGYCNSVPVQLRKRDGTIIDTLLSSITHRDPDGNMRSMTVLVDVTDRLKAELELETQNAELKKINDNLNQFTHIVSHDLAGPLRAVQHTATWIEEDLSPDGRDSIQQHINRLKDQISHLASLISDLTEYSRASSAPKDIEVVDLRAEISEIIDVIDNPGKITFDVDLSEKRIETFRPPLMLVLRNLIENAVKYHDKDEGVVKVSLADDDQAWKLIISDDGPGIDPKHHAKIMLPFRKLERKDKVPGNGMGLALVQKAVESIGGTIEIVSNPDEIRGTSFIIDWPKPE